MTFKLPENKLIARVRGLGVIGTLAEHPPPFTSKCKDGVLHMASGRGDIHPDGEGYGRLAIVVNKRSKEQ